MKKVKLIFSILILFTIIYTTSVSIGDYSYTNIDKIKDKTQYNDIKINVTDIDIIKEKINIGEIYESSAIISMKVKNHGKENIELSNLDIYPYQGSKPIKYFVSTSKEDIHGFIGNINSGETKDIKMGITLHNTNEPIKLEMKNIEDIKSEKIIHNINIK